jgi:hypothetical protein
MTAKVIDIDSPLHTVSITIQEREGRPTTVRVFGSVQRDGTLRQETFDMELGSTEDPDDLRDWMRQVLAMAVEAL